MRNQQPSEARTGEQVQSENKQESCTIRHLASEILVKLKSVAMPATRSDAAKPEQAAPPRIAT
jgi:hypothetical protein